MAKYMKYVLRELICAQNHNMHALKDKGIVTVI